MFSILCIIVAIVQSKLKVIRPPSLANELGSQLEYALANFGNIPFGHRLMGLVDLSYPIDGCQPIPTTYGSQFVLMERGNCTFVTKVRNAQTAGYSFAIIGDNVDEEFNPQFAMMDDSTGYSVQIPSVLIKKKDFEVLRKGAQLYSGQDSNEDKIFMLMKFDLQKQDNVRVILGLGLLDGESYRIIKEFQQYYTQLKEQQINYTLVYEIKTDQNQKSQQISPDCLNSSQYCAQDPDGVGLGTGRNIVEETLKQLCLFSLDQDKWFDYMIKFRTDCTLSQGFAFCGNNLFKSLNIPVDKINQCISESWNVQTIDGQNVAYNYILEQQLYLNNAAGIFGIPSVLINSQPLMGYLTGKSIFGDICNSFSKPPKVCSSEIDGGIIENEEDQTELFLMIGLVTLLIGLFAIVLYYSLKKIIQRDSRVVADHQVNEMVSNYIKFYEGRDKQKQAM